MKVREKKRNRINNVKWRATKMETAKFAWFACQAYLGWQIVIPVVMIIMPLLTQVNPKTFRNSVWATQIIIVLQVEQRAASEWVCGWIYFEKKVLRRLTFTLSFGCEVHLVKNKLHPFEIFSLFILQIFAQAFSRSFLVLPCNNSTV